MKAAQVAQNKMMRMLNGSTFKDHVTTKQLLEKFYLPSVNQISAEIKITEAWKIMNIIDYPITLEDIHFRRISSETKSNVLRLRYNELHLFLKL